MDHSGEDFLAGAGFPVDDNRYGTVLVVDLRLSQCLLHVFRTKNHIVSIGGTAYHRLQAGKLLTGFFRCRSDLRLKIFRQTAVFVQQGLMLGDSVGQGGKLHHADRLDYIVVGSGSQRLHGRVHIAIAREQDHVGVFSFGQLLYGSGKGNPVHFRHAQIGQYHGKRVLLIGFQSIGPVRAFLNGVP